MDISFEQEDLATVFSISGSMDATNVEEFNDAWERGSASGSKYVFDLSGLDYVSSAGLRCFLSVGKSCMASKLPLAFCCMGEMVADVFRITGFSGIFKIYPTRQDALNALG